MKSILNFILARNPSVYSEVLKLRGNYSLEKLIFLNLISNEDVVFDIGANRGYYTILFSHLVGKMGEVHAFEPVASTFSKLSQEVSKHQRFNNVYLNNVAAGETDGKITLYMPGNDDGQASIAVHQAGSWTNAKNITEYECKVVNLDNYAIYEIRDRLDFVKCDVEGAELLAIKGFQKTLAKYLPILYLEICGDWIKNFNYSPNDITSLLTLIGYSNFYLITSQIKPLIRPNEELLSDNVYESANLLCTAAEVHSYKIKRLLNSQKLILA